MYHVQLAFQFKYLRCVLNEPRASTERSRKVGRWRRVAGAFKALFNTRDLPLECARVLHWVILIPVLVYAVRQRYGGRRRYLELGLYRWTPSGDCCVLEW